MTKKMPDNFEAYSGNREIGKCRQCDHMSMKKGVVFCGFMGREMSWHVVKCSEFTQKGK